MLLIYMLCLTVFLSTVMKKKSDLYPAAFLLMVGTVYVSNEILSIGNHLNKTALSIVYGCLVFLLIGLIVVQKKKGRLSIDINREVWTKKDKWEKTAAILLGAFLFLIFIMSLITIPHTVDSMTYNMTRIAYWARNQSVAHYATNDVRAVTTAPIAEFINLQVYILHDKSDVLFNLVQSLSYITNTFFVMGICKKLGVSAKYRYLCALLYTSMPIAFAEAFTTQIEQFATVFMLIFVYVILDLLQDDFRFVFSKEVIVKVLILGACIAFGYHTKPSVLFGMLIFAVWLLIVCLKRKDKFTVLIPLIAIAATEIVVLAFPETARNIQTFHALSSSDVGAKHMIDTFHPLYLIINTLKNLSINLPNIYFPEIADVVKHAIFWLAYKFGIDINDPAIAHDGAEYILRGPQHYVCDSAVNPVVYYLAIAAFFMLVWKLIRRKKQDKADAYIWAALLSFGFFCFGLKYELYSTRYMLTYLALFCPAAVIFLSKLQWKEKNLAQYVIPVIVFMCIVEFFGMFLYHGERVLRHMVAEDRIEGYFEFRKKDENSYRQLGEYLADKEYENLGVYLIWRSGEYPIWKLVDEDVRIEAVNVQNETAIHADPSFVPDYIVVKDADPADIEDYMDREYRLEKTFDEKIYLYKLYE